MDRFVVRKEMPKDVGEEGDNSGDNSSNEAKKPETKRNFRTEWLAKFSWLRNKNNECYCIACNKSLISHYSHLKVHASLQKHLRNVDRKKNQIQLEECLKTEQINIRKKVYNAELMLTMFCVQHNLPFLLMDFMPKLLAECCPDSKIAASLKCGRTKSKMLTEVLGDKAKQNIISVLKTTKFSCIIDETTDISGTKSLVIVVRYYDKVARKVRDRFLSLIEVSKTDAESLYNYIVVFFSTNNIPLKNVIGLATDGANVMAGEIGGLKAKFMKDGDIFYIKCSCHSLHLCSSYACKQLPVEIDKLCRHIYTFFSHSAKRIHDFKEFQDYCQIEPHKILGVSNTRWLSLEGVINRIIEQWDALQLYFLSNVIEVNGINAAKLANMMGNPVLKAYFLFLSYILKIINDLNKEFQSEKDRLPYLYSKISMTLKLILSNFMKNNVVKNLDLNRLINECEKFQKNKNRDDMSTAQDDMFLQMEQIFIGNRAEEFLEKCGLCPSELIKIKENALRFYTELVIQLKIRFDFARKDLQYLSIITPIEVLSNYELSLFPLISSFPNLVESNAEDLVSEWKMLRLSNIGLHADIDIADFWEKVSLQKNGLGEQCFKNLTSFVFNILSLPHSSAAAERKFSDVNLIKTKIRNQLNISTVDAIMLSKELIYEKTGVWSPNEMFD